MRLFADQSRVMTTFIDGPAKGQHLLLKRSPQRLVVVFDGNRWDALDQPWDKIEPGEQSFVYEISRRIGNCHINRAGGRGGFYPITEYKLAQEDQHGSQG